MGLALSPQDATGRNDLGEAVRKKTSQRKRHLAGPFRQEEGCLLQCYQEGPAAWSLEGVILTCR